MNAMIFRVCATLSLLGLVGEANAATLITNGSFETPVVSAGGFTNFTVATGTLTGWNVIGPTGDNVSIVSGSFGQNGVTFEAQDGSQWLDLTGDGSNSTEGVTQSVATTAGDKYQLSFYVGNTTGGSIFGTTSTVNVTLNGGALFSAENSTADTTGLNWEQFTQNFVASGATTTLGFVNGDPSSDNSNGLDNIVLTDLGPATTSSVPEPFTLSLFGAGLAGAVAMRRRKKPKA